MVLDEIGHGMKSGHWDENGHGDVEKAKTP